MNPLDRIFKREPKGHVERAIANRKALEAMHTKQEVYAAKIRDYARRATIIFGCRMEG